MSIHDEDVEALTCLGLTERQARIYLSLVFSGRPMAIKMISKGSTVARQDTYKVITKLYKKGLVEKIISTPTTFKAIPLQEALNTLLQSKAAEIDSALTRTNELLKKFENKNETSLYEEPQFLLTAGKERIISNVQESVEQTKESIDMAGPWEAFATYIFSGECLKNIKKTVVCRIVISKPENNQVHIKIEKFLKKSPNFQLKYVCNDEPFLITIYDKKVVTFGLLNSNSKFDLANLNVLQSTNTSFVRLIQNYFDALWGKYP